jgi:hypothetical protein
MCPRTLQTGSFAYLILQFISELPAISFWRERLTPLFFWRHRGQQGKTDRTYEPRATNHSRQNEKVKEAATMVNLTSNAVAMLYNKQAPDGFEPWLQIIDIKKIKPASGTGGDRYRYAA